MSRMNALERLLGPYAITNITLYLVIGQTFVYLTAMLGMLDVRYLLFVPALVAQGEWWRMVSFVFVPPNAHWLFIAFAMYLLYLFGSGLEQAWGAWRYNLFLLVGYVLTVAVALLTPGSVATNLFIGGAIFLAYAWLNPDFTMMLFFVLPVKIKWLALLAWLGYGYTLVTGPMAAKLGVLAAVGNFLLFFGKDIVARVRTGKQQVAQQSRRKAARVEAAEVAVANMCKVCGRTAQTDPQLDFRYRTEGDNEVCYCTEHLPKSGATPTGS
jgi:hypothetical protein